RCSSSRRSPSSSPSASCSTRSSPGRSSSRRSPRTRATGSGGRGPTGWPPTSLRRADGTPAPADPRECAGGSGAIAEEADEVGGETDVGGGRHRGDALLDVLRQAEAADELDKLRLTDAPTAGQLLEALVGLGHPRDALGAQGAHHRLDRLTEDLPVRVEVGG